MLGIASNKVDKLAWTYSWSAIAVFIGIYFKIMNDWTEIYSFIDFQFLITVITMLIIMALIQMSGLFQLLSLIILRKIGSNFYNLTIIVSIMVFIFSFFISNFLALIIVVNFTLTICDAADLNPEPLLFQTLVFANLAGMISPISSYTSIYIALKEGWTFWEFLSLSLPFLIPMVLFTLWFSMKFYAKELKEYKEKQLSSSLQDLLKDMEASEFIDRKFFSRAIIVITLVFFLLIFGPLFFGITIDIILVFGALLVIILIPKDMGAIFKNYIDWDLVFFFGGFFIISSLIEKSNLMSMIVIPINKVVESSPLTGLIVIGWFYSIATAFIENLPFIIFSQPLLVAISADPTLGSQIVWWTVLASVNISDSLMLVSSVKGLYLLEVLEKRGNKINFISFFKYGGTITFIQLIFMSFYIILFVIVF